MGFGNKKNAPAPEPEPTGIENETISSSQEAVAVPYLAGERKIALKWITRIYNQNTVEAPVERPGKK